MKHYLGGWLLYPMKLMNKHWAAVAEKPNVSKNVLGSNNSQSKGQEPLADLHLPNTTTEESVNIVCLVFLCFSFFVSAIQ